MTIDIRHLEVNTAPEAGLPPIQCTTWCEAGDGHTNASDPADQYCSAGYHVIDLMREEPEPITPGAAYYRRELSLSLQQDPFTEPFISSWISGAGSIKLTRTEAREYAARILELADPGRPDMSATAAYFTQTGGRVNVLLADPISLTGPQACQLAEAILDNGDDFTVLLGQLGLLSVLGVSLPD